jgi:dolichol-phosphate mannosyltransferase
MTPSDDVTIVIAARNEAASVGDVIRGCATHAARILVIVDRRTTDCTIEQATAAGAEVLIDGGRGKGHAMRQAIPHILTPITVFIDADGSHDWHDIPRLLQPILDGAADHVSASRLKGGSSELHGGFDEFFRLAGSSLITACINHRFGVRLSESQNGFRAVRTSLLRALDLRSDSTTIEQEMIIKTLGLGFRMGEVASHEYRRVAGTSNIKPWRVAVRYVCNAIRYLYLTSYPRQVGAIQLPPVEAREPARR